MSKTADKIKSLLAEYEGRHPGALKLKPKSNKTSSGSKNAYVLRLRGNWKKRTL